MTPYRAALGACLLGALASTTFAQDDAVARRPADGAVRTSKTEVVKLSTVMKSKVLIQEDQSAGQVVDVVLSDNGCVDYVIASYDDQYYAIPYSATTVRYSDRVVFVDITPAQFKRVTFFGANNWPDFYANNFQSTSFKVFGVDTIRNDRHSALKPQADRADDRQDRRDDRQDSRQDRRDDRQDNAKSDRREQNREGTAGEKGTDTPRDKAADSKTNPNEKSDAKSAPPKPDLSAPKSDSKGSDKPKADTPKSDAPKSDLPKAEKPKSDAPKPIAPGQPLPKDKKNP